MISTDSSWSSNDDNELLWIYIRLKYPSSTCYVNQQCREDLKENLQIIFQDLSNSLIDEFEFDDDTQIQLDWCNLIGMKNLQKTIENICLCFIQ